MVTGGTVGADQAGEGNEMAQGIQAGRDAMAAGRDLIINQVAQPAARSAYLGQVRRIVPPSLQDRDEELADLARFCLEPKGASYAWWQAGPWAGKSALLSSFVLRPPQEVAERVRIVSFFITARLAAQDTREAFTEVLMEQLAALLGQPLPPVLHEARREAFLLGLLSEAASMCQEAGRRLVLVVDGLDEDRRVASGPGAHSIAALLPLDPPAGMRVIVAGRPNPPVPDDVPGQHPLRDPAVVRALSASPHARDVQLLARHELQRLLHGGTTEQDLVGLVATARGGLCAWDLAELAGVRRWEVTDVLHAVGGRTLESRPSILDPAGRPDVYLLGHDELQTAAVDYLGDRLAGYRERLHAWAAGYRARGWPPETPEYLLTSYFRLLADIDDVPRMTELAGDVARHDRMLELTGGDAAALAEAWAALDRIAASDAPDLASALALACHRDYLADRSAHVPESLPAVWATLGQLPRAQALATSMTSPVSRVAALAEVAGALVLAGQKEQAAAIADQAEDIAQSITDPFGKVIALAEVTWASARAGRHQQAAAVAAQAEETARFKTKPTQEATCLAVVARALAMAGKRQQALALARSVSLLARSAGILAPGAGVQVMLAEVQALAGQRQQAEAAARSIADDEFRSVALASIAGILALAGKRDRASALAAEAEATALSIATPVNREITLAEVVGPMAVAGEHDRAEALARSFTSSSLKANSLAKVALALVRVGEHDRGAAMAAQAEAAARSINDPADRARELIGVARGLIRAGQPEQAASVVDQALVTARSVTEPRSPAGGLLEVSRLLAQLGKYQQALDLARSVTDPYEKESAKAAVAWALALSGQYQRAEATARSITAELSRERALAKVAQVMARAGQHQRAESIAESIADQPLQVAVLAEVARVLAQAGQHERAIDMAAQAEATARSIAPSITTSPSLRAHALADVAWALAETSQHERAASLIAEAEATARSITREDSRDVALTEVARIMAHTGQHQQAQALARCIIDPYPLAGVAEVMGQAGETHSASRLAAEICAIGPWTSAVGAAFVLMPSAFTALAHMFEEQERIPAWP